MSDKFFNIELKNIRWLVYSSYFFALMMDSMSIMGVQSEGLFRYAPVFTLLALLFWTSRISDHTHLFTSFVLGLFFDASTNSLLGAHAALFCILTFFMLRIRLQFKAYPLWHQSLLIGFYMFFFHLMQGFILGSSIFDNNDLLMLYIQKSLVAALIWPLVSRMLDRFLINLH